MLTLLKRKHKRTTKGRAMASLTEPQKEILLRMCNEADKEIERRNYMDSEVETFLIHQQYGPLRENNTGTALVRKGLAKRNRNGSFTLTCDGYWLGDTLRIWKRQQLTGRK